MILTIEEPKEESKAEDDLKEEHKEEEEPKVLKEDEALEEEIKKEIKEEEPKIEEVIIEKPTLVKLKPPQFITNFIHSLPFSFPQINYPLIGSLFEKPVPAPLPMPAPLP
ncbi:hypothetical protein, partial [Microbacterium aurugineum]|uniref:hypothetical protein n=1 Tax=Microbacterium aurugineum TaxID=2851642 RepID=UPI0039BDD08B